MERLGCDARVSGKDRSYLPTIMSTGRVPVAGASAPHSQPWCESYPAAARDTDFKEKYPPDRELGQELADTARVWKVYRGEAIEHDDALLKTWNDTVNILLTFAGLFSAAVTSFVIASTDALKPDPNAYVANVLSMMLNSTTGTPALAGKLQAPPPLSAAPTQLSRVVNGLWFTSLFLSLTAALLCILVKQWLDEYMTRTRGSAKNAHQWAQRRSFYFQGLTTGNVPVIVSFLPFVLHLALFLFLTGLTAYLWDLDRAIRWMILSLLVMLLTVYTVSLIVPLWSAACPYATPLLAQLSDLGYAALIGICLLQKRALLWRARLRRLVRRLDNQLRLAHLLRWTRDDVVKAWESPPRSDALDLRTKGLRDQRSRRPFDRLLREVTSQEQVLRSESSFEAQLDCSVLERLFHDVSESDAVAVAWQSLGALLDDEPDSPRAARMRTVVPGLVNEIGGARSLITILRSDGDLDDMQLGRITRSALWLDRALGINLFAIICLGAPDSYEMHLHATQSPDAALIYYESLSMSETPKQLVQAIHRIHEQSGPWPLTSTAMNLVTRLDRLTPTREREPLRREATLGLLHCCDLDDVPANVWKCAAHIMGYNCPCKAADSGHECGASCVASALALRVLRLHDDEKSEFRLDPQTSPPAFDDPFHVQLIVRILSSLRPHSTLLSPAVWTVLTDDRYLSILPTIDLPTKSRIGKRGWAWALRNLVEHSDRSLYASFGPQYTSAWCKLLSNCIRDHLLPHEAATGNVGLSASDSTRALKILSIEWRSLCDRARSIDDLHLRRSTLRAALSLSQCMSIACCSLNRDGWTSYAKTFLHYMQPVLLLPNDLDLAKEEFAEWAGLFATTVQHCISLGPSIWQDLVQEIQDSAREDAKAFFADVCSLLRDMGPCTKGDCAGQQSGYWLPALGPMPHDAA